MKVWAKNSYLSHNYNQDEILYCWRNAFKPETQKVLEVRTVMLSMVIIKLLQLSAHVRFMLQ